MYFSPAEITAFWDTLAPAWRREPALIRQPFAKPLVSAREFLVVLQLWADNVRTGKAPADVALIDADALPRPEHETLADCERHIAARWPEDWYLYIADGVHVSNGDVWERAVELLLPALRREGGLPAGGLMLDLFFGNYGSTPTGIHLDSSDNLAFITRGRKRMLFWPPERFAVRYSSPAVNPSHQRALIGRYADHLDTAIVLDAEEGDVIYWPREYWHIGATNDDWAGMVTIPMWWSASPAALASTMIARVLDIGGEPQRYAANADDLAAAAAEPPLALRAVIEQARAQIASRLDPMLRVAWARFVTAYGFTTPPAPRARPALGARTHVRVRHPVAAVSLAPAAALVGGGHASLVRSPALAVLADRLCVGTEHTVADLAAHAGVPPDDGMLCGAVADLVAFRALDVI